MYREHVVRPRRVMLRAVLAEARSRDDLRPDADLDLAVNALVGALYAQRLADPAIPQDWDARIVDTVLRGIGAPDKNAASIPGSATDRFP
jgi:hypothetical protein